MEGTLETTEYLQKLFERGAKSCCDFNEVLFKTTLHEYIGLRLQVHWARKHANKTTPIPFDLFQRATMTRHRLERLAPCRDCIVRLNPTKRIRPQVWNPLRARAYREALR